MRGDASLIQLIDAHTLSDALQRMNDEPGIWTPIAGGTELMVAHAAGRLATTRLINVGGLKELAFIASDEGWLSIGGGANFGAIRRNEQIIAEFPLLAKAAAWVGAIANQNRATLAGNIVNASPAADAPPALLAYGAEIELISKSGSRRMPYADFHLSYKRTVLRPNELVYAVHLPCRFTQHASYLRKVGTRNAMAITKVALAATAMIVEGHITEVHLAAASLADRPVRLIATERTLLEKPLSSATIRNAEQALLREAAPIDDIRSTAAYRARVGANLLREFLLQLVPSEATA